MSMGIGTKKKGGRKEVRERAREGKREEGKKRGREGRKNEGRRLLELEIKPVASKL